MRRCNLHWPPRAGWTTGFASRALWHRGVRLAPALSVPLITSPNAGKSGVGFACLSCVGSWVAGEAVAQSL